jgi:hypothetical protein
MTSRAFLSAILILCCAAPAAGQGQGLVRSADATAFMGTWTITMTNPEGARETVRISDQNGFVAATVQLGKFPPTPATGLLKDGDMLVLTGTRLENGQPIRVVMSLLLNGDTMHLAQMLEASQTIKRGSGRRDAN